MHTDDSKNHDFMYLLTNVSGRAKINQSNGQLALNIKHTSPITERTPICLLHFHFIISKHSLAPFLLME